MKVEYKRREQRGKKKMGENTEREKRVCTRRGNTNTTMGSKNKNKNKKKQKGNQQTTKNQEERGANGEINCILSAKTTLLPRWTPLFVSLN